jgi:nitroreductase
MSVYDLAVTDALLSTTRAVRKRLDFDKPVPREVIEDCLELAIQAPTGSNRQGWRWMVVTDADKRLALADLYRKGVGTYLDDSYRDAEARGAKQDLRVFDSARYLSERLQDAPVHVIPCIAADHLPADAPPRAWGNLMGSIFPAMWSFQLALRARGLGSVLTTLHLKYEDEAAALLGIPDGIVQAGLLPVAYTIGTDFKAAKRRPLDEITHWNEWS